MGEEKKGEGKIKIVSIVSARRGEGKIGTVILAFSIMRKLCGSIDLVTRSRDHRLSITRSSWPEASGRK